MKKEIFLCVVVCCLGLFACKSDKTGLDSPTTEMVQAEHEQTVLGLENELGRLQTDVNLLGTKLEKKDRQLEQTNAQLVQTQTELAKTDTELRAQLAETTTALETEKAKLAELHVAYDLANEEKRVAEQHLQEQTDKVANLETQLVKTTTDYNSCKEKLEQTTASLDTIQLDLGQSQQKVATLETEIEALKLDASEAQQKLVILQEEHSTLEQDYNKELADHSATKTLLAEANTTIEEDNTKIADLETDLEQKSVEIEQQKTIVIEKNTEIARLEAELIQVNKDKTTLQSEKDALDEQNTKLLAQVDSKQAEVDALQAQLQESKTQLGQLQTQVAEQTTQIEQLQTEKEQLTTQVEQLSAQTNQLQTQIEQLNDQIAVRDEKIAELEGQSGGTNILLNGSFKLIENGTEIGMINLQTYRNKGFYAVIDEENTTYRTATFCGYSSVIIPGKSSNFTNNVWYIITYSGRTSSPTIKIRIMPQGSYYSKEIDITRGFNSGSEYSGRIQFQTKNNYSIDI